MERIAPLGTGPQVTDTKDPLRTTARDSAEEKLRKVAQQLEATFLAEMLKHTGVGESRKVLGGGIGEDQFGSFLRQAQAEEMAKSGGIGLAEHLFEALKEKSDGTV